MLSILLAVLSSSLVAADAPKAPTPPPAFKKVIVVYLENTDYRGAMKQPFLKELAKRGALLTDFHAETHPSQPNYVALVAGTTEGVHGDSNSDLDERYIGDLLASVRKTWRNYAEGYPGDCFLEAKKKRYVRKHTPFLSIKNVQSDPKQCANVVDASGFQKDFRNGNLADFTFYTPDLDNDGHDTGVKFASMWMEREFSPLINNPVFASNVLLIVTFDEDDSMGDNHIYTVLFGQGVTPGSTSGERYNHYSILRTIEDAWKLGSLGKGDASAKPISGIWKAE
jgi:hypothetical protein